jgi:hypothetical protein
LQLSIGFVGGLLKLGGGLIELVRSFGDLCAINQ